MTCLGQCSLCPFKIASNPSEPCGQLKWKGFISCNLKPSHRNQPAFSYPSWNPEFHNSLKTFFHNLGRREQQAVFRLDDVTQRIGLGRTARSEKVKTRIVLSCPSRFVCFSKDKSLSAQLYTHKNFGNKRAEVVEVVSDTYQHPSAFFLAPLTLLTLTPSCLENVPLPSSSRYFDLHVANKTIKPQTGLISEVFPLWLKIVAWKKYSLITGFIRPSQLKQCDSGPRTALKNTPQSPPPAPNYIT